VRWRSLRRHRLSHGPRGLAKLLVNVFSTLAFSNCTHTVTELVIPKKHHRKDKRDSFGRKVAFIPSPEFLAKFVDWRQSRLALLPSKRTFDRWHEALLKEHVWHQWMLERLVKNMDIPTRNILAHLYVHAKTLATEQKMGSANLKRGLIGGRRHNPEDPPDTSSPGDFTYI
jgi:hypothetical protein